MPKSWESTRRAWPEKSGAWMHFTAPRPIPISAIAKTRLHNLAEAQNRTGPEVCRLIARIEAADETSDLQPFLENLKDHLSKWRTD